MPFPFRQNLSPIVQSRHRSWQLHQCSAQEESGPPYPAIRGFVGSKSQHLPSGRHSAGQLGRGIVALARFWQATTTRPVPPCGLGPADGPAPGLPRSRAAGDREKPGTRLDCFCFGVHGGMPACSIWGKHSRPTSASPPSQPPVFPGLQHQAHDFRGRLDVGSANGNAVDLSYRAGVDAESCCATRATTEECIRDFCYLCWNLTLCQRAEVRSHCSLIIVILSGLCYLYNVIVFEDK